MVWLNEVSYKSGSTTHQERFLSLPPVIRRKLIFVMFPHNGTPTPPFYVESFDYKAVMAF